MEECQEENDHWHPMLLKSCAANDQEAVIECKNKVIGESKVKKQFSSVMMK